MNPLVFNISIGAGVTLIGVGLGLQFGLATALFTVGILVLGLTVFVARVARGN